MIIRSTSFGRMMCQLQGGRMKNEAALKPKAKLLIFVMMPMPDTLDVNGMKIELCYYKILYNRCLLAQPSICFEHRQVGRYYIYYIGSFAPSTGPKFKIQSCILKTASVCFYFTMSQPADIGWYILFRYPHLSHLYC